MARSIRYCTSTPSSLQVGMSFQDCVSVTLVLYWMRSLSNTHSARTWPARQTSRFSEGLLTFDWVWLPTSCVAASPPDRYGREANFAPGFFSRNTVRTWSSRLEPVPPLLNGGFGPLAGAVNSFTFLCGSVGVFPTPNLLGGMMGTGLEPVPPILNGGLAPLAAAINSFTFLCGSVVLSHSTNWSSAMMDTGVSSRQLNGILADSGSM